MTGFFVKRNTGLKWVNERFWMNFLILLIPPGIYLFNANNQKQNKINELKAKWTNVTHCSDLTIVDLKRLDAD